MEHPSLPAAGLRFACPVPHKDKNVGKFHGLEIAAQDKAAVVTEEERDPERVCARVGGAMPVQRSSARCGVWSEPREGKVPSRCEQGGMSCSWLPSRQEGKEKGSHVLKKLFYLPLFAHYSVGGGNPLHLVWLI